MPSLNPESLSQLPSLDAFNIENIYLKLSILVAILTFAIYYASRNLEQGLIPGIEVISTEGTDDITYTKARRQFKKHARELMWRGVKTVSFIGNCEDLKLAI